jgi:hypothetical protein
MSGASVETRRFPQATPTTGCRRTASQRESDATAASSPDTSVATNDYDPKHGFTNWIRLVQLPTLSAKKSTPRISTMKGVPTNSRPGRTSL